MYDSGDELREPLLPETIVNILDRVTDAFFALDSEWRFTYVNEEASRLLFRDRKKLIGKSVWDEFPEARETQFYVQYTQAMAEQTAVAFEEFYAPIGLWYNVRAFPSESGLTVYFRDVTVEHQAHEEYEQYYRSLFYYNPDAVYSLTLDGRVLDVNLATEQLTGFTASELIGKPYDPLIVPNDLTRIRGHFQQAASGTSQTYTVSTQHKDGRVLRVQITNLPIMVDGRIVGVYGIAKNITELHEAVQRLRQSESRLAHAQRIAQLGYWDWNIADNEIERSDELYQIYGLDRGTGNSFETFMERIHPGDRAMVERNIQASLLGQAFDMEFRIVRPDGSERVMHSQAEVEFLNGVPQRILGTNLDITERKRAEEARHEAESKFLALVQAAHDAIVITDAAGEIKLWNRGASQIFGFEPYEIVGQPINSLAAQKCRKHRIGALSRLLKRRENSHGKTVEFLALTKDGQTISVELSLNEVWYQEQVHFIAIMRDVTERNKMETFLRKSDKLTAVGQLAAGVAHEIRNPLTSLKGFLQLMASENKTQHRYIQIMSDELRRIELIVSELLVLAKPQVARFSERDLQSKLTDVTTLLSAQAMMSNVEIILELEPNLPPIRCEQNQIKQVFINLIRNAIEAMPEGGRVFVKGRRIGDSVEVQVMDEGSGIPPELIRRLGDPFYTTKENGTGLGLMVSHKIIAAHQGTLNIESEVGQGTTVTVTLPIPTKTAGIV